MTLAMLAVVHISCGRSSGSQDRASCTSESVCGEAATLAECGNASDPSVAKPFTGSADSVELLYFYGKSGEVTIEWGRAAVNSAQENQELLADYQAGTLPLRDYLRKRWRDLSEDEIDSMEARIKAERQESESMFGGYDNADTTFV